MLPFYSLHRCIDNLYAKMNDIKEIEELEDLLELTFQNGYIFWFIGSTQDSVAKLMLRKEDTLLWVKEHQVRNAFVLPQNSKDGDIRLLQIYRLLDEAIGAAVLGELDIAL